MKFSGRVSFWERDEAERTRREGDQEEEKGLEQRAEGKISPTSSYLTDFGKIT